ncbi:MAG TPA: peptide chain release factor N(5)-glutamine methyltransferase [Wenzhouxiangella sp.]|nr:peptide chain release factor N(5)-glutamine methyltransferase [Wenzhouxiangella sp.]
MSNTTISIEQALLRAATRLDSRLEADLLACHVLGCERSWLYARGDRRMTASTQSDFDDLVEQRLEGRPVAYLLGEREFYGLRFMVDERVLIPRPETELLVELALSLPLPARARVCDVGTGSGCIALVLAAKRPDWQVVALDESAAALEVAEKNLSNMKLDNVKLCQSDLLQATGAEKFDLIVSNPPYIEATDEHLDKGDLRFEPRSALEAGADGLDLIRALIAQAPEKLNDGGWLFIEHGYNQAAAVRKLLEKAGFDDVRSHFDLAAIERVSGGKKAG